MAAPLNTATSPWLGESDFDLGRFRREVERDTDVSDYPHAADVRDNVLVYSAPAMAHTADRHALQAELIHALADGPGVVVFDRGVRHRGGRSRQ